MKCRHCQCEWNMPQGMILSSKNCPFCGKPLIEKKTYPMTTIEGVLQEIIRLEGEEVLSNGGQLTAIFADLAPKMVRERRLVRVFTTSKANQTIMSARNAEVSVRRKCYEQAVLHLRDEYFIAESAARMMCGAFYLAVFGEPAVDPVTPPVPPPQPAPAPKAKAPENADDYYSYAQAYESGDTIGGKTVAVDMGLAVSCYEQAATMGHLKSQIRLGELYSAGSGVKQNLTESIRWYTMAAEQNNVDAMRALLRHFGAGWTKDNNQYAKWAARLAELGNPQGLLELGRCYRDGVGLPVNLTKARYYLNLASRAMGADAVVLTAVKELKELEEQKPEISSDFVCNGTVLVKYTGSSLVVHIPVGVTEIGAFAFSNNQRLKSLVMPNTVHRIGASAFQDCKSLTSITLSPKLTHMESRAFSGCDGLKKIVLPDTLEIMGMQAFINCRGLTEITIPGKIKEISSFAFQGCTSLRSVDLSYGVQYVGKQAFAYCTHLELVRIPNSLLSVDDHAFEGCASLHQFTASPAWRAVNSALIQKIIR